jgi:hypothetical protein
MIKIGILGLFEIRFTILFKSKTESQLRKMIDYIVAYDDQFNNEKDLDYFIDIWEKRMKSLKPNQTI